jgi:toxin ParE1/3/4
MSRRVVIARTALTDLAKIGRWITEAGAPVTAKRYVQRIKTKVAGLSDASGAGRAFEADGSELRVIGFERRIMIAYRVEKTRIIVTRVFYGGQDWERALRGAGLQSD